jgi:hypothetical protein
MSMEGGLSGFHTMGGDEAMEQFDICMGANLTCMNDHLNRMGKHEDIPEAKSKVTDWAIKSTLHGIVYRKLNHSYDRTVHIAAQSKHLEVAQRPNPKSLTWG